jgi:hypothetical protein
MKTSNLIPVFLTVMLLTACASSGTASATPTTFDVKALQTSAVQTIVVNMTQTAAAQPTLTPAPPAATETQAPPAATEALTQPAVTETPALTPAGTTTALTPSGTTTAQLCDNSLYVSDVSVQDGSTEAAGTAFVKTWRVKNIGTCSWVKGYQIIFGYGSNGKQLGGLPTAFTTVVAPGSEAEISVNMKAPTKPGNYSEYWRLANNNGVVFGPFLSVIIVVVQ